jgi:hypothetical protein
MRTALAVLTVVVACGGDAADWDGAVADYEEGLCTSTCRVQTEDACRRDIQADLTDARALLDPAGEQRCIDCLDTRLRLIPLVEVQACQPTAAQNTEVVAACGASDEACAGFP